MRFKSKQSDVLKIISKVQNVVEKRNTMPVLMNVLLSVEKQKLSVYATDLEVSLTDTISVEELESGKIAVSAKSLFDIVKELDDSEIEFQKKENNWLQISQGKSIFNIIGIKHEEFPVFPKFSTNSFTLFKSKTFLEMIEKTIYSVSNDETRYHLNGVYFVKRKKGNDVFYRMVATDGHRLSLIDRFLETENKDLIEEDKGVIIPKKGLSEIKKVLESFSDSSEEFFQLALEGSQLIIRHQNTVLMVRLIEGKYPNYEQLIPQNLKQHLLINKSSLSVSLKRVSLLSNQKSKGITFAVSKDKLEVFSNNPELGDAKEEISIDYQGNDLKIGFNAKYILDILNSCEDEQVDLSLNDQLSPGILRPMNDTDYTCVIMPMRI